VTTAFIATTGGHLTQPATLAERIPPDPDSVWVTHANEQSTSLLADRDVEYIPYVGVRDVPGVLRCVLRAHALHSALANLAAGRFAVVSSRLGALGEAGDDHQQELAEELAARGLAMHRAPDEITVDDLLAHPQPRGAAGGARAPVRVAVRP
jgi:hypothetical protein